MAIIVLSFGAGNMVAWYLLRTAPDRRRLRIVQCLATGVTWAVAIGAVGIAASKPTTLAPAAFLILLATAGFRYRLPGIIAAMVTANLATAAALAWHAGVRDAMDPKVAFQSSVVWLVLITLMGTVIGIFIRASDEDRQEQADHRDEELARYQQEIERLKTKRAEYYETLKWQEEAIAEYQQELERQAAELAKYPRQYYGLTEREGDVLELLITGLTYRQIARRLNIGSDTVKRHVSNIGDKLGVTGGRRPVEQRARELNLVPADRPNTEL